ncbi:hypothetical protein K438DRAFT_309781 [Mycena galopus ATCC 62051]|nr:hypothetical protein K438DRAFT_309781 [Mycena galopus ATCC 62051]
MVSLTTRGTRRSRSRTWSRRRLKQNVRRARPRMRCSPPLCSSPSPRPPRHLRPRLLPPMTPPRSRRRSRSPKTVRVHQRRIASNCCAPSPRWSDGSRSSWSPSSSTSMRRASSRPYGSRHSQASPRRSVSSMRTASRVSRARGRDHALRARHPVQVPFRGRQWRGRWVVWGAAAARERIGKDGSEKDVAEALREMAELFGAPHPFVSSFELLQSRVVDGLLQFATDGERKLSLAKRKEPLLEVFAGRRMKVTNGAPTPFSTFVKKFQESLTRMESLDVITVAQGVDDLKRSSPSLLTRQLRLHLVAGDESDVPRNLHNIVVSIHAIATFQALHDYLRPRVAGLLGSGS